MHLRLYKIYFKRITINALVLQLILTISFAFIQMPHFLEIMHGISFTAYDIFFILIYKTIEWINSILIIAFISCCLYFLYLDLFENNLELLLLQMGENKQSLVRLLFFLSIVYANLFFLIDSFVVPQTNYELKNKLLRITKDKFVSNLVPGHMIMFEEWNLLTGKRSTEHKIEYLLLNKASDRNNKKDPEITLFIKDAFFYSQDYLNLNLSNGIGKIKIFDTNINFKFESGSFNIPNSYLFLKKTDKDKTIFELTDSMEIFKKFRLFILALVLPFWIFVMFFAIQLFQIIAVFLFFIMFFYAIDVFTFNFYIFFGIFFLIILIYRKTEQEG